ncbi:MAG TPA: glycosyltransferase, partial [Chitinophagaceae bacterium]|nr:glycosyltransferase [Chitinophagaceae bacterium]
MALQPEISVCIFSYNFGNYLEQAIESVIAQKLSVPFEIVIGDDKSTDESPAIIARYQQRFPDLIRVNINEENIGGTANWLQTMST